MLKSSLVCCFVCGSSEIENERLISSDALCPLHVSSCHIRSIMKIIIWFTKRITKTDYFHFVSFHRTLWPETNSENRVQFGSHNYPHTLSYQHMIPSRTHKDRFCSFKNKKKSFLPWCNTLISLNIYLTLELEEDFM